MGSKKITDSNQINWNLEIVGSLDGRETARNMFDVEIRLVEYGSVDKFGFDKMKVNNHRVTLFVENAEQIFPKNNRPRGDNDIKSIEYHMNTKAYVDPIMILNYQGKLYVLDGVHRLVAAYIVNSNIRYSIWEVW